MIQLHLQLSSQQTPQLPQCGNPITMTLLSAWWLASALLSVSPRSSSPSVLAFRPRPCCSTTVSNGGTFNTLLKTVCSHLKWGTMIGKFTYFVAYTVWWVIFRGANFHGSWTKPPELIFVVLNIVAATQSTSVRCCANDKRIM